MNPLGITDRVITAGANDTFTLAVNDGAPTVIEVAAGTYYAMEELATAVQTAIDSSPFSSTGTFRSRSRRPPTRTATGASALVRSMGTVFRSVGLAS